MGGIARCAGAVLLAATAIGCGGTPAGPGEVPYGRQFELKVGGALRVGDDGLTVTFDAVKSDSRCPIDAICIDAGDAVAVFTFQIERRRLSRDVHTRPPRDRVSLDGYSVQLTELQPYPRSDRPTPTGEYIAQLRIERGK